MTPSPIAPRIIRSHRKTVSLVIERDGSLTVRAPLRLPEQQINTILREKADWIRTKQAEVQSRLAESPVHQYLQGELFWFLGEKVPLHIINSQSAPLQLSGNRFLLDRSRLQQAAKLFETWYRTQARRLFIQHASKFAVQMGVKYTRLRLSSARTRWGSCSSTGTISLTWRLVMAPPAVIDYVIVHELTHILFKNHSSRFWAHLATILPDYRTARLWLKKNGHLLQL